MQLQSRKMMLAVSVVVASAGGLSAAMPASAALIAIPIARSATIAPNFAPTLTLLSNLAPNFAPTIAPSIAPTVAFSPTVNAPLLTGATLPGLKAK